MVNYFLPEMVNFQRREKYFSHFDLNLDEGIDPIQASTRQIVFE